MTPSERAQLEAQLRSTFDAGDLRATATAAIRGYGPELYGFLVGLTHDPDAAGDVFAASCEKLWQGLATFRWDGTLRAWAFTITRHQFYQWSRGRDRRRRAVPLSDAPLSAAVEQVRSTTALHLRTEVKDAFARLRAGLAPDDQLLLHLRLDAMAWRDIARVLVDADAPAPDARAVAALRKRYERLKAELRAQARAQALVP